MPPLTQFVTIAYYIYAVKRGDVRRFGKFFYINAEFLNIFKLSKV